MQTGNTGNLNENDLTQQNMCITVHGNPILYSEGSHGPQRSSAKWLYLTWAALRKKGERCCQGLCFRKGSNSRTSMYAHSKSFYLVIIYSPRLPKEGILI